MVIKKGYCDDTRRFCDNTISIQENSTTDLKKTDLYSITKI